MPVATPEADMRFNRISKWLLVTVALSVTGFSSPRRQSTPTAPEPQAIRISSNLVHLPVSVTDRTGNFVDNLTQDDFRIFEDGRPQKIAVFEARDLPVTVGLVVDHSGSMSSKLPEVSAAGAAFAKSSNPQDHLFVVNFNEMVSLMLPSSVSFTSDPQELEKAIGGPTAHGQTALYDAIIDALDHLSHSNQERQALILVTDGGDNVSRHTFAQVLETAMKSRALIYCIALYSTNDEDAKPRQLLKLSKVTGGETFFPQNVAQVAGIVQKIADTLRKDYILGFVPAEQGSGKWRTVRVLVSTPGKHKLEVRTRSGYVYPGEQSTQNVEKAEN
jgi:VWFA-related protein